MWTLTDHVCRECMGRVLRCGDRYRCADCGATGEGSVQAVCACGMRVSGRDAGWRCAPNPQRGGAIVAAEIMVMVAT